MIYLTGDTHGTRDTGKLSAYNFPAGQDLRRDDYVIVLGDFGLPRRDNAESFRVLSWLDSCPWTTLFIDGNHEDFPLLNSLLVEEWRGGRVHRIPDHEHVLHLMRGQVFDLDGTSLFAMGGATSVDRAQRVEGSSWFAEELPSDDEYAEAAHNLEQAGWQVDYVLSHTCPQHLAARSLYPDPGWQLPQADELTMYFDWLDERLDYRRWYFGHYHKNRNLDDRHTLLYDAIVPLGEDLPAPDCGSVGSTTERFA